MYILYEFPFSILGVKQFIRLLYPFRNRDLLGTEVFAFLAFQALIGPLSFLDTNLVKALHAFRVFVHHGIVV